MFILKQNRCSALRLPLIWIVSSLLLVFFLALIVHWRKPSVQLVFFIFCLWDVAISCRILCSPSRNTGKQTKPWPNKCIRQKCNWIGTKKKWYISSLWYGPNYSLPGLNTSTIMHYKQVCKMQDLCLKSLNWSELPCYEVVTLKILTYLLKSTEYQMFLSIGKKSWVITLQKPQNQSLHYQNNDQGRRWYFLKFTQH